MTAPPPPHYTDAVMETKGEAEHLHPAAPPQQPPPPQPYPSPTANPPAGYPPSAYPPPPGQYHQPYPPGGGAYYQAPPATTVVVPPVAVGVAESIFPATPMQTTCPNCHQAINTKTTREIGGLIWLISVVLCIVGLFLCAWIPCLIDDLKDVLHSCPSCGAVVGRHYKLGGMSSRHGYYGRRGYY